mmetsp:Transcript_64908/g.155023  ORF Transcript_64908/g.155023 Transcript_64908/m.155023 type:complete len:240 (+) Transcript_64908:805-1524(+)
MQTTANLVKQRKARRRKDVDPTRSCRLDLKSSSLRSLSGRWRICCRSWPDMLVRPPQSRPAKRTRRRRGLRLPEKLMSLPPAFLIQQSLAAGRGCALWCRFFGRRRSSSSSTCRHLRCWSSCYDPVAVLLPCRGSGATRTFDFASLGEFVHFGVRRRLAPCVSWRFSSFETMQPWRSMRQWRRSGRTTPRNTREWCDTHSRPMLKPPQPATHGGPSIASGLWRIVSSSFSALTMPWHIE